MKAYEILGQVRLVISAVGSGTDVEVSTLVDDFQFSILNGRDKTVAFNRTYPEVGGGQSFNFDDPENWLMGVGELILPVQEVIVMDYVVDVTNAHKAHLESLPAYRRAS